MDILETIITHKAKEIEERMHFVEPRRLYPLVEQQIVENPEPLPSLREALLRSDTGIIAEMKRKSPSKGWIRREARAGVVPLSYQQNGAAALSILTDTEFFGGYDEFVQEARATGVTLPILYKNFVISEYQLYQARFCGASAVLLIAAVLDKPGCKELMAKAHELGLEVLLEMHSDEDLEYADLHPDVYGINNRNLGSFVTDVENSFQLINRLPQGECLVSESGIKGAETICRLREAGFNGVLMGERFMREDDPGEALRSMIEEIKQQQ
jgi:indole-3-glycerol phosphate synthase